VANSLKINIFLIPEEGQRFIFSEVFMSAILMILAFVVVVMGLNWFEFGRPD